MAILKATRSKTFRSTATILDASGNPFNLGSAIVWFTVKPMESDRADDSDAVIALSWVDGGASVGITVAVPTAGVAIMTVDPAITATLTPGRQYRYDMQIEDINGDITRVDHGALRVSRDITRRTTTP